MQRIDFMLEYIRVVNFKQACAYVSYGLQPHHLEYDTEHGRMVFVFKAEDTKEAWELWKSHKFTI